MNLRCVITEDLIGKTVKFILKYQLEISNSLVKRLKYSDNISRNSIPVHINEHVSLDDIIEVSIDFNEECENVIPQNIGINIIYEDDCLIVLNKQPFIVVHPTLNHPTGTIANALSYYYDSKGINKKIRPVSRLDKDTSGIIVFAKNEFVQDALIKQMKSKTFQKEYIGIVYGLVENRTGIINLPIGRKPDSIIERHVCVDGSASITKYEIIENLHNATLLKFNLETGRTHQIRVHCQAIGHPLVGETLYKGNQKYNPTELINRQALHSQRVSFIHPLTKEYVEFTAQIPEDIQRLLLELALN